MLAIIDKHVCERCGRWWRLYGHAPYCRFTRKDFEEMKKRLHEELERIDRGLTNGA